jgi:hypothetical protein
MHDEEFKTEVREIAQRMWENPRVRAWCTQHGMSEEAFFADRMKVARVAYEAGGPWVEALDF